nr:uncharacterized protein LOC115267125 [Aedes albopictus]
MKLIEKTIRAVRKVGLEPLILVMDQFATNQKMVKEVGVTKDNPYFTVDNKKVYVMWDSPHLMKSGRNMLKKHNAVYDNEIASFDDIEKLYEVDSLANPRLAPRLTDRHIKLPPFSPMNVSLAARTLSQSVASALDYYSNTGKLEERARESVNFIRTHDLLFDTFNSRQKNCLAKPYKSALQEQSCHWRFLENTKASLEKLYFTSKLCFNLCKAPKESRNLTAKQRRPNYVGGFIHNINALKLLWDELVKRFDCKYLYTNNLCQDCLENFFSEIRRRCGSNDTPDCLQFGAAFKYACIEAVGCSKEGTNCEKDDSIPLLSTTDPDLISRNSNRAKHVYKFVPLDVSTPMEIPVNELNGLMYILGAGARKLYHLKCMKNRKNLRAEQHDNLLNDDSYNFCKIKQSVYGRSFILPNSNLYRIEILCFAAFKQKFHVYLHKIIVM